MNARFLAPVVVASLLPYVTGCAPGILWACKQAEVTAVSLNPCDVDKCGKPREAGIPFYLPKPLLIVSKNFRNIEEAKTGLTDSPPIPIGFDDQAKYADLNARTNFAGLNTPASADAKGPTQAGGGEAGSGTALKSAPYMHSEGAPISPGVAPADGLTPATFYTYQIVFVPDLTQKYGLRIHGGPGEIRAAMNLVNGWQFTGIGPFYIKDSSTAQNILASGISTRLGGQAAADILHAAADLAKVAGTTQAGGGVPAGSPAVTRMSRVIEDLPHDREPMVIPQFAEIHVYEPHLTPDGQMEWTEIVHLCFNREALGLEKATYDLVPPVVAPPPTGTTPPPGTTTQSGGGAAGAVAVDTSVARAAVAGIFGVAPTSPALVTVPPTTQAGGVAPAVPAGGVSQNQNQVQVDCGDCRPSKEFNLFKFGGKHEAVRPKIQSRVLAGPGGVLVPAGAVATGLAAPGQPLGGTTNPNTQAGGGQGTTVTWTAPAGAPLVKQTDTQQGGPAAPPASAAPVVPPPPPPTRPGGTTPEE